MVRDQLNYQNGDTQRADQKLGEDMYTRLGILVTGLKWHKELLRRLVWMMTDI